MKRCAAIILVLICMFTAFAYAEGTLTVTAKNLIEIKDDSTAYFFAKIENTGNESIVSGYGSLEGLSSDDEAIISEDYIATLPSDLILKPGEYAYVGEHIWERALEDVDIATCDFYISSGNNGFGTDTLICEATFDMEDEHTYQNYVYVTFTNTTEEIVYGCIITVALFNDADEILFVAGDSFDALGIHPGNTVTIRLQIDSDIVEHFRANSITPTKADAIVYYEIDD